MSDFQVVYHQGYDAKGFTNENTLSNALLTNPDEISPVITFLQGKESDKFPLTFHTQGQSGGIQYTDSVNDIQFTWKVMGRLRKTDVIAKAFYASGSSFGGNNEYIYAFFKTEWLKRSHRIRSSGGATARIMKKPERVGAYYKYTLQSMSGAIAASELQAGVRWGMIGGATVSESFSKGTESNVTYPGKKKSQCSIIRRSYKIGGNLANKYVECKFNIDGKQTNLWIDFERWQHMLNWKQEVEEEVWISEYNRNADGTIDLIDEDSGLPIPTTAGMFQQIPNQDTYATLTAEKIKRTVGDVMTGATDSSNMEVMLFCGEGFADDFDTAMKSEASGFSQITGDKFVTGSGRNLRLGGFFTAYEHVDGHVVYLKKLPFLDHGALAEIAERHPISGKPMSSHEGHFIDMSVYDGEKNVKIVHQKGRSMIMGIEKGMAPVPMDYRGNNGSNERVSTDQDVSSVHMLTTIGLAMRRNTHCFSLRSILS